MSHHRPPADRFLAEHGVGDVVDGTVVSVAPFGTFVEVADGLHGLVHESEASHVADIGHRVRVRILDVDASTARLSLRPA